jgi:hypothetical protein
VRAVEESFLSLAVTLALAGAGCSQAGCSQTSAPTVAVGTPMDSSVAADSTAPAAEGGVDAPAETAAAGDAGPTGSCVVRPACETCIVGDAGVCCVYPNPNPPPGPENAISCNVCPADAGPKFVTLTCNNESDCPKADVCCIAAEPDNSVRSFCAAACDPTKHQVALCDANATQSKCPPTSPCSRNNIDDWNLPHCYGTCGGVGP